MERARTRYQLNRGHRGGRFAFDTPHLAGMALLVRAQRKAEAALLWPRLNGA